MRLAPFVLLLLLSFSLGFGQRMQAKCSACRAVARELAVRLDKEKPRNHLDMRHRLDKHGNRYGKVIDYKLSELRLIELLDDLCDGLTGYEFAPEDKNSSTPARWAKTSELNVNRGFDRHRLSEDSKLLASFCGGLIEQYEDDVTHAIRAAQIDANGISDFLCHELSKYCTTQAEGKLEEEHSSTSEENSNDQGISLNDEL